jgi:conjugal transfer mating pair stabilization protein TraG
MLKLIISSLFIMASAVHAHALDMEFYTYGGFEPVTNAFLKIALIFSDANYRGLFYTVIVIGMLFGGIATFSAIARGARTSPLAWAIPVILGVLIFFALIIPRGNITVYDPVVNRFQVIGGVPDGIIAVAGTLNLIERGLIDIIYTSATPYSHRYQDFAGGIGFNVLLKSTGFPLKPPNQYMDKSLRNYMNDCLFFELMRPGTSLSVNDINSNSTDFLIEFGQAQNPALFTTFYDDTPADRTGTTLSCTEAWININTYLVNPLNFTEMVEYTCANSGFSTSDVNELNKCRDTMRTYIDVVFGSAMGITEEHFLRQAYMAKVLNDVLLKNDPDLPLRVIANRNTMISGIGIGIIANDWLPVIRAVVTAVVIGLLPFFIIFIPTPVVGRALGIIIGFFIWLVSWGVTDAVVHGLSMDLTVNAFERIRDNQLGLVSMIYFPDESMKALGVFGMMRSFGIMIATVITTMLVKFGGHALAIMAGSLIGSVQSHGTGAARGRGRPSRTDKLFNTYSCLGE